MAVPNIKDPLAWLAKHLEGDGDLIREMIKSFTEELMAAEAQGHLLGPLLDLRRSRSHADVVLRDARAMDTKRHLRPPSETQLARRCGRDASTPDFPGVSSPNRTFRR